MPTIAALSALGCNHMHTLTPEPCYRESCIITCDNYFGRKFILTLTPSCIYLWTLHARCIPYPPYWSAGKDFSPSGFTVWRSHGAHMRSLDNSCQVIGCMISFPNRLGEQVRMVNRVHLHQTRNEWLKNPLLYHTPEPAFLTVVRWTRWLFYLIQFPTVWADLDVPRLPPPIGKCMSYTEVDWLWYRCQAAKITLFCRMEVGSTYLIWRASLTIYSGHIQP